MSEGQALVGATIAGKYRLKRLIGAGGMGSVYEGQHLDLAKRVAVKIIDSQAVMSPELATRFKREARAASAVESEGIVQVFDVGRDPEVGLYMVMEYLQGEDLEMRLRRQPGRKLEPLLVANIGHQCARALAKAHAARVIHRDLKPANIFLTDRDDGSLRVKVLDFGISKLLASEASVAASKEGLLELTQAGMALGTPQYMSPEQAQGLTTVDRRTDVWGLGAVLYEALTGAPAYPELQTYQQTILKILTERAPLLERVAPWVPVELARVVTEAMEHDPDKRIPDCGTFAARLAAAVPELGLASTGPFDAATPLGRAMTTSKAFTPPAPPSISEAAVASAASASSRRPVTLGDDTQVVVRASNPDISFADHEPSNTMLAEAAAEARAELGKATPAGAKPAVPPVVVEEDVPQSTGDPTMFQAPAWVAAPEDRPTTKTGVELAEPVPRLAGHGGTNPLHGALVAALTALVIVGVGLGVFAITRGGSLDGAARPSTAATGGPVGASATGAGGASDEAVGAQGTDVAPAPPPTGEAFAAPPATGTAVEPSAPVVAQGAKVDAGVELGAAH